MKKADIEKLEREIGTKATELAKLMRRRADAKLDDKHFLFQVDKLMGGAVVITATALSPEDSAKICGEH